MHSNLSLPSKLWKESTGKVLYEYHHEHSLLRWIREAKSPKNREHSFAFHSVRVLLLIAFSNFRGCSEFLQGTFCLLAAHVPVACCQSAITLASAAPTKRALIPLNINRYACGFARSSGYPYKCSYTYPYCPPQLLTRHSASTSI